MARWKQWGVLLGAGVSLLGGALFFQEEARTPGAWKAALSQSIQETAEKSWLPGIAYGGETEKNTSLKEWVVSLASHSMPLGTYVVEHAREDLAAEDEDTLEMLAKMQAEDENSVDENGQLVGTDESARTQQAASTLDLSPERLRDFDYLVGNFYTVDSVTYVNPEDLNVDTLLAKDMTITKAGEDPKILIYHTHSQETFADSNGDVSTSIVGIGRYLTELLNDTYGISTLHHEGVYDLIDGKLDRSEAYELAAPDIARILEENPSIEVVIDLHRDGVADTTHLVTEINGKQTAQIMFFNGMSRTRANGDLSGMPNPYIQDNLAFSLQMKLKAEELYPGFTRRIYLKGYRYNMNLMPKMLLVEAGAQTNTVEEMKNAMEPLAEILSQVLE